MGLRPGRLLDVYLVGYFAGRSSSRVFESIPAHELAGLRLNQWVSASVLIASILLLIIDRVRLGPPSDVPAEPAPESA